MRRETSRVHERNDLCTSKRIVLQQENAVRIAEFMFYAKFINEIPQNAEM